MKTVLTYNSPVTDWVEGLPLGNGENGMMFFGTPKNEIFMLNHDRLWQNKHKKVFCTAEKIDELKTLVKNQKTSEVHKLFQSTVKGDDTACNSYQPLADLNISVSGGEVSGYSRSLDLENAVLEAGYSSGDNRIKYRAFCDINSRVSRIILSSEQKTDVSVFFTRASDPDCEYLTELCGNIFFFKGRLIGNVGFTAAVMIETNGIISGKTEVTVSDATHIEFKIAMGVSLQNSDYEGCCTATLKDCTSSFEDALAEHSRRFSEIFNRCRIDLKHGDTRTAEEIFKAGQKNSSPELSWYEMAADMARYVLICSSMPGTLPCNLQGIWNREISPEWDGGFTTDMNLQMYYWCANSTGLFECQQALFDWITSNRSRMAELAEEIFGAKDAAYIPQYTDCFMEPTCWKDYGDFQVLWGGAAPWLAQQFFEYRRFTLDEDFLKNTALPFMKSCANFYAHILSENPEGRLHNYISCSPESFAYDGAQILDTATMDIALIRELFGNIIKAEKQLNIETEDSRRYKEILEKLAEYPIDESGTLLEWHDSRCPGDPGHRHLSHIYPLYPGKECFADEALKSAATKAVERRLAHNIGQSAEWSYAWYSCCFARLRNPEKERECMQNLLIGATLSNLFSVYSEFEDRRDISRQYALGNRRIFQADGMLGYYAAVSESLMQCFDNRIVILPSLIEDWKKCGSVYGLCAYNGLSVDISWENGLPKTVTLHPQADTDIILEVSVKPKLPLKKISDGYLISLTAGKSVTIDF